AARAKAPSNSAIFGPVVSQSDLRTSATAARSSSSIVCRPYGRTDPLTGPPFTVRPSVPGTPASGVRLVPAIRLELGHDPLQVVLAEPAGVRVARVLEPGRQPLSLAPGPVLGFAEEDGRLDDVHVFELVRRRRLVPRDQDLVHLLAGPDAD